ncbi:hypothetical protein GALL_457820 [mine drainage metagenome]|uniref:Membrane dipeptidase n=1 Tax=mine drainage metagenome TaxID=410659 RepID=A0A1J5PYE2_9ZZZZ
MTAVESPAREIKDGVAAVVEQALELSPVIDGHNDWAWECREHRDYSVEGLEVGLTTDTDVARLQSGRV